MLGISVSQTLRTHRTSKHWLRYCYRDQAYITLFMVLCPSSWIFCRPLPGLVRKARAATDVQQYQRRQFDYVRRATIVEA